MKKKNSFGTRLRRMIEGRGFYIILFLCIAAIGVSGYVLFFAGRDSIPELEVGDYLMDYLDESPAPDNTAGNGGQVSDEDTMQEPGDQSPAVQPVIGEAEVELPEQTKEPEQTDTPAAAIVSPTPPPTPAALFVWPVNGAVVTAFSGDTPIYDKTMGDWRIHNGIDIESPVNTKVVSMASGVVLEIYDDALLGTTVVVDHGGGLKSVYANLMAQPTVSISQSVGCGEVIGSVGNTALGEWSVVSHLHFEVVLDGIQQDPESYMP